MAFSPVTLDKDKCAVSEWGEWSTCTKPCGHESRMRSRVYLHRKRAKECRLAPNRDKLQDTEPCGNPACDGEEESVSENIDRNSKKTDGSVEGVEDATNVDDSDTVVHVVDVDGNDEDGASVEENIETGQSAENKVHQVTKEWRKVRSF